MVKKLICVGVIIVMIITFTGCKDDNDNNSIPDDNSIPFDIEYSGEMLPVTETYLKEKVDSLQDLIDLSNENNYPFFDENDEFYNWELSQNIREYDDVYFTDKALILIFFYETSNSPTKIDSVSIKNDIKDDTIKVILARPNEVYTASEETIVYAFIIGVNKNDVESANEVNTEIIHKGKVKDFKGY